MSVVPFSVVSALSPVSPGTFTAQVSPDWTIGAKPNGGYLLTMLGRAAAAVGPHADVLAASAHYLHPPQPGEVTVEAEVLRAGRAAGQLRARMLQDGRLCVEALLTTGTLEAGGKPHWEGGLPERPDGAWDDAHRVPGTTPTGIPVALMEQVDLRIEPASWGFATGRPSGRGELRGWLALPGGEPFDPAALLFAVDAFPPATFDIEPTGWVPTLELTVYVRALPEPGPVRVLHQARLVDGGRVDEACFVWDAGGRLVAQSTQLAGIRLG
ncbi:thioesterase family protein [Geodermatophilus sp. YIM 151500]|uniref:thioesterase family protein n=1 Tax=Geodermatophilus sp. YIM 151500 TaxID=2984531 RepID=UPI0021E3BA36|nr:thioesterase family protein [Geodermatophilus sp. YIM 151500]MCV2491858.1 thioesterase family protein [Geodermatophilus sp. YIM 151500]